MRLPSSAAPSGCQSDREAAPWLHPARRSRLSARRSLRRLARRACLVPDGPRRMPASRRRPRSIPGGHRVRAVNWLVALLCHGHYLLSQNNRVVLCWIEGPACEIAIGTIPSGLAADASSGLPPSRASRLKLFKVLVTRRAPRRVLAGRPASFGACDGARRRGSHFRRARGQEDGDDRLRATIAARERVRYGAMFTTHRKRLRHGYGHG